MGSPEETLGDRVRARLPRLVRAMVRGAHLAHGEAVEVLVEYRIFGLVDEPSSARVARAGGQLAAIRCGIRNRHEPDRPDGSPEDADGDPETVCRPVIDNTFA